MSPFGISHVSMRERYQPFLAFNTFVHLAWIQTLPSPKISLRWKDKLPHPHLCWAAPEQWALRWVPTKVPTSRFLALQHPQSPITTEKSGWYMELLARMSTFLTSQGILSLATVLLPAPRWMLNSIHFAQIQSKLRPSHATVPSITIYDTQAPMERLGLCRWHQHDLGAQY